MKLYFSIIIPTYNRKNLVIRCLKSIFAQDFPKEKYEIIVIDNNSTDGTVEALKNYPIKLLVGKKRGGDAARNKGIKKASGKWLAFIDSDCTTGKNWLSELYKASQEKKYGCLAGKVIQEKIGNFIDDIMKKQKTINQKKALSHTYLPFALLSNVAYKKEVFEKIGQINENLGPSGDIDLTWRMLKKTDWKVNYVPRAVVYHQPRKTLWGFLRQIYFYGYGEKLIEKKHKLPSNTPPRIKRTIGYFGLAIPRFVLYILLKRRGKKLGYRPSIAFLDFLYNAAYLSGRFKRG